MIAKDVLFNYATGFVRDEIAVGISYGVPPNHVREVVLTLLRDVPQVLREPPPEVLVWNYGDFAIQYSIKYWIADYGVQERVRDRVASSLWYALRRHSIEIPFPTRTVHVRDAGRDEDEQGRRRVRARADDRLCARSIGCAVSATTSFACWCPQSWCVSLARVRCWCDLANRASRCSLCAAEGPKSSVTPPTARFATSPKLDAALSPARWR